MSRSATRVLYCAVKLGYFGPQRPRGPWLGDGPTRSLLDAGSRCAAVIFSLTSYRRTLLHYFVGRGLPLPLSLPQTSLSNWGFAGKRGPAASCRPIQQQPTGKHCRFSFSIAGTQLGGEFLATAVLIGRFRSVARLLRPCEAPNSMMTTTHATAKALNGCSYALVDETTRRIRFALFSGAMLDVITRRHTSRTTVFVVVVFLGATKSTAVQYGVLHCAVHHGATQHPHPSNHRTRSLMIQISIDSQITEALEAASEGAGGVSGQKTLKARRPSSHTAVRMDQLMAPVA